MATTISTLMSAEPNRAHTLGEVHDLVRLQGLRYLDCNPYQAESAASFWKLMDRFMMAKKGALPKPGKESEGEIASRMRNTLTRIDFVHPKIKREKKYPGAIPIKGARTDKVHSDYAEEETRTERFKRRENEKEHRRVVFPEVLHEDQLLDLFSNLTYWINCVEQATQYAAALGVKIQGCSELDARIQSCNDLGVHIQSCKELNLNEWLTEELYQTGAEFAMKQVAFDWVQNLVEQAELFETPRRGKEEKAIKYVTIAVIVKEASRHVQIKPDSVMFDQAVREAWSAVYSGTSQGIVNDIKMLVAKRHLILRASLYEPIYFSGEFIPQNEDELHGTKSSQSTAVNRDNTRSVTPPIVVRGGFGK
ncbi:MAG: hypothetical protein Q9195_006864 [Heterodermia aff. obscurata]